MGKMIIGKNAGSIKEFNLKKEINLDINKVDTEASRSSIDKHDVLALKNTLEYLQETLFNKIIHIEELQKNLDKKDSLQNVDLNLLLKPQDLDSLQQDITNMLKKTDSKILSISEFLEQSTENNNEIKELLKSLSKHIDETNLNKTNADKILKQELSIHFVTLENCLEKLIKNTNLTNLKIDEYDEQSEIKEVSNALNRIEEKNNTTNLELIELLQKNIIELNNLKTKLNTSLLKQDTSVEEQNKLIEQLDKKNTSLESSLKICIVLNIMCFSIYCFNIAKVFIF